MLIIEAFITKIVDLIVVVSIILAVSFAFALFKWPYGYRQKILMENRVSYSKAQFIEYFSEEYKEISNDIWDTLTKEASIVGFKPKPEDSIPDVFGLMDEDLDDIILEILERCKRKLPSEVEIETMSPIDTVEDLVKFISSLDKI